MEIKLPWQLLNFTDPSRMMIHDDYYENYGVEHMKISEMYLGVSGRTKDRIEMKPVELKGWNEKVTSHERLKSSYYMLKDYWTKGEKKQQ